MEPSAVVLGRAPFDFAVSGGWFCSSSEALLVHPGAVLVEFSFLDLLPDHPQRLDLGLARGPDDDLDSAVQSGRF